LERLTISLFQKNKTTRNSVTIKQYMIKSFHAVNINHIKGTYAYFVVYNPEFLITYTAM